MSQYRHITIPIIVDSSDLIADMLIIMGRNNIYVPELSSDINDVIKSIVIHKVDEATLRNTLKNRISRYKNIGHVIYDSVGPKIHVDALQSALIDRGFDSITFAAHDELLSDIDEISAVINRFSSVDKSISLAIDFDGSSTMGVDDIIAVISGHHVISDVYLSDKLSNDELVEMLDAVSNGHIPTRCRVKFRVTHATRTKSKIGILAEHSNDLDGIHDPHGKLVKMSFGAHKEKDVLQKTKFLDYLRSKQSRVFEITNRKPTNRELPNIYLYGDHIASNIIGPSISDELSSQLVSYHGAKVSRLSKEHLTSAGRIAIYVDIDKYIYASDGTVIPSAVDNLNRLYDRVDNAIVIYTSSSGKDEKLIWESVKNLNAPVGITAAIRGVDKQDAYHRVFEWGPGIILTSDTNIINAARKFGSIKPILFSDEAWRPDLVTKRASMAIEHMTTDMVHAAIEHRIDTTKYHNWVAGLHSATNYDKIRVIPFSYHTATNTAGNISIVQVIKTKGNIDHIVGNLLIDTGIAEDIARPDMAPYSFFNKNLEALGITLDPREIDNSKKISGIVLTHTHPDHILGLSDMLKINPDLKIYVTEVEYRMLEGLLDGKKSAMFNNKEVVNIKDFKDNIEFIDSGDVFHVTIDDIDIPIMALPATHNTPGGIIPVLGGGVGEKHAAIFAPTDTFYGPEFVRQVDKYFDTVAKGGKLVIYITGGSGQFYGNAINHPSFLQALETIDKLKSKYGDNCRIEWVYGGAPLDPEYERILLKHGVTVHLDRGIKTAYEVGTDGSVNRVALRGVKSDWGLIHASNIIKGPSGRKHQRRAWDLLSANARADLARDLMYYYKVSPDFRDGKAFYTGYDIQEFKVHLKRIIEAIPEEKYSLRYLLSKTTEVDDIVDDMVNILSSMGRVAKNASSDNMLDDLISRLLDTNKVMGFSDAQIENIRANYRAIIADRTIGVIKAPATLRDHNGVLRKDAWKKIYNRVLKLTTALRATDSIIEYDIGITDYVDAINSARQALADIATIPKDKRGVIKRVEETAAMAKRIRDQYTDVYMQDRLRQLIYHRTKFDDAYLHLRQNVEILKNMIDVSDLGPVQRKRVDRLLKRAMSTLAAIDLRFTAHATESSARITEFVLSAPRVAAIASKLVDDPALSKRLMNKALNYYNTLGFPGMVLDPYIEREVEIYKRKSIYNAIDDDKKLLVATPGLTTDKRLLIENRIKANNAKAIESEAMVEFWTHVINDSTDRRVDIFDDARKLKIEIASLEKQLDGMPDLLPGIEDEDLIEDGMHVFSLERQNLEDELKRKRDELEDILSKTKTMREPTILPDTYIQWRDKETLMHLRDTIDESMRELHDSRKKLKKLAYDRGRRVEVDSMTIWHETYNNVARVFDDLGKHISVDDPVVGHTIVHWRSAFDSLSEPGIASEKQLLDFIDSLDRQLSVIREGYDNLEKFLSMSAGVIRTTELDLPVESSAFKNIGNKIFIYNPGTRDMAYVDIPSNWVDAGAPTGGNIALRTMKGHGNLGDIEGVGTTVVGPIKRSAWAPKDVILPIAGDVDPVDIVIMPSANFLDMDSKSIDTAINKIVTDIKRDLDMRVKNPNKKKREFLEAMEGILRRLPHVKSAQLRSKLLRDINGAMKRYGSIYGVSVDVIGDTQASINNALANVVRWRSSMPSSAMVAEDSLGTSVLVYSLFPEGKVPAGWHELAEFDRSIWVGDKQVSVRSSKGSFRPDLVAAWKIVGAEDVPSDTVKLYARDIDTQKRMLEIYLGGYNLAQGRDDILAELAYRDKQLLISEYTSSMVVDKLVVEGAQYVPPADVVIRSVGPGVAYSGQPVQIVLHADGAISVRDLGGKFGHMAHSSTAEVIGKYNIPLGLPDDGIANFILYRDPKTSQYYLKLNTVLTEDKVITASISKLQINRLKSHLSGIDRAINGLRHDVDRWNHEFDRLFKYLKQHPEFWDRVNKHLAAIGIPRAELVEDVLSEIIRTTSINIWLDDTKVASMVGRLRGIGDPVILNAEIVSMTNQRNIKEKELKSLLSYMGAKHSIEVPKFDPLGQRKGIMDIVAVAQELAGSVGADSFRLELGDANNIRRPWRTKFSGYSKNDLLEIARYIADKLPPDKTPSDVILKKMSRARLLTWIMKSEGSMGDQIMFVLAGRYRLNEFFAKYNVDDSTRRAINTVLNNEFLPFVPKSKATIIADIIERADDMNMAGHQRRIFMMLEAGKKLPAAARIEFYQIVAELDNISFSLVDKGSGRIFIRARPTDIVKIVSRQPTSQAITNMFKPKVIRHVTQRHISNTLDAWRTYIGRISDIAGSIRSGDAQEIMLSLSGMNKEISLCIKKYIESQARDDIYRMTYWADQALAIVMGHSDNMFNKLIVPSMGAKSNILDSINNDLAVLYNVSRIQTSKIKTHLAVGEYDQAISTLKILMDQIISRPGEPIVTVYDKHVHLFNRLMRNISNVATVDTYTAEFNRATREIGKAFSLRLKELTDGGIKLAKSRKKAQRLIKQIGLDNTIVNYMDSIRLRVLNMLSITKLSPADKAITSIIVDMRDLPWTTNAAVGKTLDSILVRLRNAARFGTKTTPQDIAILDNAFNNISAGYSTAMTVVDDLVKLSNKNAVYFGDDLKRLLDDIGNLRYELIPDNIKDMAERLARFVYDDRMHKDVNVLYSILGDNVQHIIRTISEAPTVTTGIDTAAKFIAQDILMAKEMGILRDEYLSVATSWAKRHIDSQILDRAEFLRQLDLPHLDKLPLEVANSITDFAYSFYIKNAKQVVQALDDNMVDNFVAVKEYGIISSQLKRALKLETNILEHYIASKNIAIADIYKLGVRKINIVLFDTLYEHNALLLRLYSQNDIINILKETNTIASITTRDLKKIGVDIKIDRLFAELADRTYDEVIDIGAKLFAMHTIRDLSSKGIPLARQLDYKRQLLISLRGQVDAGTMKYLQYKLSLLKSGIPVAIPSLEYSSVSLAQLIPVLRKVPPDDGINSIIDIFMTSNRAHLNTSMRLYRRLNMLRRILGLGGIGDSDDTRLLSHFLQGLGATPEDSAHLVDLLEHILIPFGITPRKDRWLNVVTNKRATQSVVRSILVGMGVSEAKISSTAINRMLNMITSPVTKQYIIKAMRMAHLDPYSIAKQLLRGRVRIPIGFTTYQGRAVFKEIEIIPAYVRSDGKIRTLYRLQLSFKRGGKEWIVPNLIGNYTISFGEEISSHMAHGIYYDILDKTPVRVEAGGRNIRGFTEYRISKYIDDIIKRLFAGYNLGDAPLSLFFPEPDVMGAVNYYRLLSVDPALRAMIANVLAGNITKVDKDIARIAEAIKHSMNISSVPDFSADEAYAILMNRLFRVTVKEDPEAVMRVHRRLEEILMHIGRPDYLRDRLGEIISSNKYVVRPQFRQIHAQIDELFERVLPSDMTPTQYVKLYTKIMLAKMGEDSEEALARARGEPAKVIARMRKAFDKDWGPQELLLKKAKAFLMNNNTGLTFTEKQLDELINAYIGGWVAYRSLDELTGVSGGIKPNNVLYYSKLIDMLDGGDTGSGGIIGRMTEFLRYKYNISSWEEFTTISIDSAILTIEDRLKYLDKHTDEYKVLASRLDELLHIKHAGVKPGDVIFLEMFDKLELARAHRAAVFTYVDNNATLKQIISTPDGRAALADILGVEAPYKNGMFAGEEQLARDMIAQIDALVGYALPRQKYDMYRLDMYEAIDNRDYNGAWSIFRSIIEDIEVKERITKKKIKMVSPRQVIDRIQDVQKDIGIIKYNLRSTLDKMYDIFGGIDNVQRILDNIVDNINILDKSVIKAKLRSNDLDQVLYALKRIENTLLHTSGSRNIINTQYGYLANEIFKYIDDSVKKDIWAKLSSYFGVEYSANVIYDDPGMAVEVLFGNLAKYEGALGSASEKLDHLRPLYERARNTTAYTEVLSFEFPTKKIPSAKREIMLPIHNEPWSAIQKRIDKLMATKAKYARYQSILSEATSFVDRPSYININARDAVRDIIDTMRDLYKADCNRYARRVLDIANNAGVKGLDKRTIIGWIDEAMYRKVSVVDHIIGRLNDFAPKLDLESAFQMLRTNPDMGRSDVLSYARFIVYAWPAQIRAATGISPDDIVSGYIGQLDRFGLDNIEARRMSFLTKMAYIEEYRLLIEEVKRRAATTGARPIPGMVTKIMNDGTNLYYKMMLLFRGIMGMKAQQVISILGDFAKEYGGLFIELRATKRAISRLFSDVKSIMAGRVPRRKGLIYKPIKKLLGRIGHDWGLEVIDSIVGNSILSSEIDKSIHDTIVSNSALVNTMYSDIGVTVDNRKTMATMRRIYSKIGFKDNKLTLSHYDRRLLLDMYKDLDDLEMRVKNNPEAYLGTNFNRLEDNIYGILRGQYSGKDKMVGRYAVYQDFARVYVNTAVKQLMNDNADLLQGIMITVVMDNMTCPVCLADAGKIYPQEKWHIMPVLPRHRRCRCTYTPIFLPTAVMANRSTVEIDRKRLSRIRDKIGSAGEVEYQQSLFELAVTSPDDLGGRFNVNSNYGVLYMEGVFTNGLSPRVVHDKIYEWKEAMPVKRGDELWSEFKDKYNRSLISRIVYGPDSIDAAINFSKGNTDIVRTIQKIAVDNTVSLVDGGVTSDIRVLLGSISHDHIYDRLFTLFKEHRDEGLSAEELAERHKELTLREIEDALKMFYESGDISMAIDLMARNIVNGRIIAADSVITELVDSLGLDIKSVLNAEQDKICEAFNIALFDKYLYTDPSGVEFYGVEAVGKVVQELKDTGLYTNKEIYDMIYGGFNPSGVPLKGAVDKWPSFSELGGKELSYLRWKITSTMSAHIADRVSNNIEKISAAIAKLIEKIGHISVSDHNLEFWNMSLVDILKNTGSPGVLEFLRQWRKLDTVRQDFIKSKLTPRAREVIGRLTMTAWRGPYTSVISPVTGKKTVLRELILGTAWAPGAQPGITEHKWIGYCYQNGRIFYMPAEAGIDDATALADINMGTAPIKFRVETNVNNAFTRIDVDPDLDMPSRLLLDASLRIHGAQPWIGTVKNVGDRADFLGGVINSFSFNSMEASSEYSIVAQEFLKSVLQARHDIETQLGMPIDISQFKSIMRLAIPIGRPNTENTYRIGSYVFQSDAFVDARRIGLTPIATESGEKFTIWQLFYYNPWDPLDTIFMSGYDFGALRRMPHANDIHTAAHDIVDITLNDRATTNTLIDMVRDNPELIDKLNINVDAHDRVYRGKPKKLSSEQISRAWLDDAGKGYGIMYKRVGGWKRKISKEELKKALLINRGNRIIDTLQNPEYPLSKDVLNALKEELEMIKHIITKM